MLTFFHLICTKQYPRIYINSSKHNIFISKLKNESGKIARKSDPNISNSFAIISFQ